MSTECVHLADPPEDRLDKKDQCSSLLDDLSEQLIKNCDVESNQRTSKNFQNPDQELKKPKRKDTPALPMPPFIPSTFPDSERQTRICNTQMNPQKGKVSPDSQSSEEQLKKPRRKDTPALHLPPLISEMLLQEQNNS
ncbi:protein phosphatase 1 regulatory subunit 17 isoform X2 [Microcaecilia unicolor]|uniref:Protein phosphatase 1 regulatory subunit 17 isoform X2 n=1 Tax=Microcaecilia unicolor TaxID=1415580 RepID=A0A6P7YFB0_9AMPH|nr:protein phosphatase 1 regulatory subunit 17 isoform X2 [Microcaecilia unicolor]